MRSFETLFATLISICTSCAAPGSGARPTAVVPPELGDRLAIAEVIARFVAAASVHDWTASASLFAEDAVWASSVGELSFRHEGRPAMLAWLKSNEANVEVLFYTSGTPTITLLARDRARSRVSIIEVLHIKATGERRLLTGAYDDELAKVNGAWLFTKRQFTLAHGESLRGTSAP
jgi:hypothetical protein